MSRARHYAILAVMLLGGLAAPTFAQEVRWRHDYLAARKEAEQQGKPLVIDFYTDSCFFCTKLDTTTFRDPAVARTMNERFIPLKINAEREANLATALRIERYPTILLASPDGKILGNLEGYMEAPKFQDYLQQALAAVPPKARTVEVAGSPAVPEKSDQVVASDPPEPEKPVPQAAKAEKPEKPAQAAQAPAPETDRPPPRTASAAPAAPREAPSVRPIPSAPAADTPAVLVKVAPTPRDDGARRNETRAQQRARRAAELLALAREDFQSRQYLYCLERCDTLIAAYGDLPEGIEASQLEAQIKSNPEWMRQVCDGLGDRLGMLWLSLADTYLRGGQPRQAEAILERVQTMFPGTTKAEAAQMRLLFIKGQATIPSPPGNPEP